ncbi:MAG: hypothetical protein SNJ82_01370 [Gemmataceae bacterium]
MPLHSRRAINLSRERLMALAQEVMQAAFRDVVPPGEGLVPVAPPAPLWSEWLSHTDQPQGVYARRHAIDWRYGELVFASAWWSDVIGRKHWLLQASADRQLEGLVKLASTDGSGNGLIEGVHPLEFLAPALSFGLRGQPPQPVVVCHCGFAGTPESLAWTGQMCGPCFDREQDGLLPAEGLAPARPDCGRFGSFQLAPNQNLITCEKNDLVLRCWSPPWTGSPLWTRHWSSNGPYALSPSMALGGLLAVGWDGRVALVSLQTGRTLATYELGGSGEVVSLIFAGHKGDRLLIGCVPNNDPSGSWIEAWSLIPPGQFAELLYRRTWPDRPVLAAVRPPGQRVVAFTGVRHMYVIDTSTGEVKDWLKIPQGGMLRHACFLIRIKL